MFTSSSSLLISRLYEDKPHELMARSLHRHPVAQLIADRVCILNCFSSAADNRNHCALCVTSMKFGTNVLQDILKKIGCGAILKNPYIQDGRNFKMAALEKLISTFFGITMVIELIQFIQVVPNVV